MPHSAALPDQRILDGARRFRGMAASEAFSESEILRTEANIRKEPIIQVRDAPTKAVVRQGSRPCTPKLRPS
jgi:hypothetical protein